MGKFHECVGDTAGFETDTDKLEALKSQIENMNKRWIGQRDILLASYSIGVGLLDYATLKYIYEKTRLNNEKIKRIDEIIRGIYAFSSQCAGLFLGCNSAMETLDATTKQIESGNFNSANKAIGFSKNLNAEINKSLNLIRKINTVNTVQAKYPGLDGGSECYISSPGNPPKNEIRDMAVKNVRNLLDDSFDKKFSYWYGDTDKFSLHSISKIYKEKYESKLGPDGLTIALTIANFGLLIYAPIKTLSNPTSTYYDRNVSIGEGIYGALSPEQGLPYIAELLGVPQKRAIEVIALKNIYEDIEKTEKKYVIPTGSKKWIEEMEDIKSEVMFAKKNPFESHEDFSAYRLYQVQYIDNIINMNLNYTETYQQTQKDYEYLLEAIR